MIIYAFAQLVLAAESPATTGTATESGGIDLLLPAAEELFAGVIAFAIVFFFIWKWAIPALNKSLEARQAAIAAEFEAAEKAKLEAESLLTDYRAQLADANSEAAKIVSSARETGESVKSDIVSRAETEAEQIKARAHEEIAGERDRVAGDLRRQVAELSMDVAQRVVGSSIDTDAQRRLVDQYIEELGGVR